MSDEAEGVPFSRVYLRPAKPLRDSVKFRRRLGAYIENATIRSKFDYAAFLKTNYGLEVPSLTYGYNWTDFFESSEIADVLDAITGVYRAFSISSSLQSPQLWKDFVSRALSEETLGYRLDAGCAVRFHVDDEFERTRASTLAGLDRPRYSAARLAYDNAFKAMDGATVDTLGGVRGVFESVEEIFKLMFAPKITRLGSAEIDKYLRPFVGSRYHPPTLNAVNKLASSFADWVDGMHTYRHAQGVEEPSPPPLGVALLIMGEGSSFLRWLIELDSAMPPAPNLARK